MKVKVGFALILICILMLVYFPIRGIAYDADTFEDNESFNTAKPVSFGTTYNLSIHQLDDIDCLNITLVAGQLIVVCIGNSTMTLSCTIYDPNGVAIKYSMIYSLVTTPLNVTAPIAGSYCIQIMGASTGTYDFTVFADDAMEDNDDPTTATPFSSSEYLQRALLDDDYYNITLASKDGISINIELITWLNPTEATLYAIVYNPDMSIKTMREIVINTYSSEPSGNVGIFNNFETTQQFTLRFTANYDLWSDFYVFEYNIYKTTIIDDIAEDNDVRTAAEPISENEQFIILGMSQNGLVIMDDDWYSYQVTNAGLLYAECQIYDGSTSDVIIEFTNNFGTVIALSTLITVRYGIQGIKVGANVTAGTYYIHVYSPTDYHSQYMIMLSFANTTHPADFMYTPGSSITWTVNDTLGSLMGPFPSGSPYYGLAEVYVDTMLIHNFTWTYANGTIDALITIASDSMFFVILNVRIFFGKPADPEFNFELFSFQDIVVVNNASSSNDENNEYPENEDPISTDPENRLTINTPADMTIKNGSIGNTIIWTITASDTPKNGTYRLYRNTTQIAMGTWTSGIAIELSVDGLMPGVYGFSIVANDGKSAICADYVIVTVKGPETDTNSVDGFDFILIVAGIGFGALILQIRTTRKAKSMNEI